MEQQHGRQREQSDAPEEAEQQEGFHLIADEAGGGADHHGHLGKSHEEQEDDETALKARTATERPIPGGTDQRTHGDECDCQRNGRQSHTPRLPPDKVFESCVSGGLLRVAMLEAYVDAKAPELCPC